MCVCVCVRVCVFAFRSLQTSHHHPLCMSKGRGGRQSPLPGPPRLQPSLRTPQLCTSLDPRLMFPTPNRSLSPREGRAAGSGRAIPSSPSSSQAALLLGAYRGPPGSGQQDANTHGAGRCRGKGVVNSGKPAGAAAAGRAEPEPAPLLSATQPGAKAEGQAGRRGKPGSRQALTSELSSQAGGSQ